ncbi:MAG: hypothetical protein QOK42_1631 [Frankiaceae bacterium]|jgi:hypothetical protein|nr:hypothetical protein [Frankiaceae bacterium]MDX6275158.1 hypothetical protein [Frankiales bacterium]
MGFWILLWLLGLALLIALIGDIVARVKGRPVRVDPEFIKLRKGHLKKRGFGIGGTKQQRLHSFQERWRDNEPPRRLND